jgi:quercetin dioxygenase-like cupin family protein
LSYFQVRDLFGGRGQVELWDLLQGRSAPPFQEVLRCRLEAGGGVGAHRQAEFSELVIGLAGKGVARVNGDAFGLGPDQVVFLPLGASLELACEGPEPLDYLIVKARPMVD